MKVDDLLKIDKKESNRTKAAFIRAQVRKKAKENNPGATNPPGGWQGSPYEGHAPSGDF